MSMVIALGIAVVIAVVTRVVSRGAPHLNASAAGGGGVCPGCGCTSRWRFLASGATRARACAFAFPPWIDRDCSALLLATGQLGRIDICLVVNAHLFQKRHCLVDCLAALAIEYGNRCLYHIFQHSHMRPQIE